MKTDRTRLLEDVLRELYNRACHHPRCERGSIPHECSCGVSAALEAARKALRLKDYSEHGAAK